METMEVDKSAMRRLINATDIQADAVRRGQWKRIHMARHAELMLNPEVSREVTRELLGNVYEGLRAVAFQNVRP